MCFLSQRSGRAMTQCDVAVSSSMQSSQLGMSLCMKLSASARSERAAQIFVLVTQAALELGQLAISPLFLTILLSICRTHGLGSLM